MSDLNKVEFSLKDLLDLFGKQLLLKFNCHHIGQVKTFNPVKQTVQVQINYQKTFWEKDSSGVYSEIPKAYPLLMDCPAIVLGGGPASLRFPIKSGDDCILFFNDRDIDNWFNGASSGSPASERLHSFSDAIALVGLRNLANSLENYDLTHAALVWGTTILGVSESKVKLANSLYTLNGLLQELITEVQNLVNQTAAITVTPGSLPGPSSPPLNAAAISAVGVNISTTAAKIAALLE